MSTPIEASNYHPEALWSLIGSGAVELVPIIVYILIHSSYSFYNYGPSFLAAAHSA